MDVEKRPLHMTNSSVQSLICIFTRWDLLDVLVGRRSFMNAAKNIAVTRANHTAYDKWYSCRTEPPKMSHL